MSKNKNKNKNKGGQQKHTAVVAGNNALKPAEITPEDKAAIEELKALTSGKSGSTTTTEITQDIQIQEQGTPLSQPVKLEQPKILTSANTEKVEEVKPEIKTDNTPGQVEAVTKPVFREKKIRGVTIPVKLTSAMQKIQELWQRVKDRKWGELKPNEDDFVLSQKSAEIIKARITHLKKAVLSIAENLPEAEYNHFISHNKILELHFLSEIEREEAYIRRYSR